MSKLLFALGEFVYRNNFSLYVLLYSFYKRISDRKELQLFKKIIKPESTIIDIGANIGLYTKYFSKLTGEKGTVHSFEPDVTNFKNFQKVTASLKNIHGNHSAISDSNQPLKIYTSHRLNVDHRTYPVDEFASSYEVPSTSIDAYVNKKFKVDYIKIDIQGAEYPALLGMKETLLANPTVIVFMEVCPSALKEFGVDIKTIYQFVRSLGFQFYDGEFKLMQEKDLTKYNSYAADEFENVIISKNAPELKA